MPMQRYARSARLAAVLAVLVIACAPGLAADAKPILLTSIGQSAEASMIKQLRARKILRAQRAGESRRACGRRQAAKYSALVAVVGGSAKGWAQLGLIKSRSWNDRFCSRRPAPTYEYHHHARRRSGEARRLSDAFIRAALPYAGHVILVEAGDQDGLFEQYWRARRCPSPKWHGSLRPWILCVRPRTLGSAVVSVGAVRPRSFRFEAAASTEAIREV